MGNESSRFVQVPSKNKKKKTTKTSPASVFDLTLTYRRVGRDVIVEVCGDLDVASAPQLERGLIDVIDNQGCRSIIVDLHCLEFIDSTGLMALMRAGQLARTKHASITLARLNAMTKRILEVSGLRPEFDIRNDVPDETD